MSKSSRRASSSRNRSTVNERLVSPERASTSRRTARAGAWVSSGRRGTRSSRACEPRDRLRSSTARNATRRRYGRRASSTRPATPPRCAGSSLKRDGVVEVARVGGVDGEHVSVADIAIARRQSAISSRTHARASSSAASPNVVSNLWRATTASTPRFAESAEPSTSSTTPVAPCDAWERADAHADEGAVLDVGIVGPTREDVVGYARVGGNHHAERLRHLVAADHDVMSAIENAHDARDGQALPLVGRRRGLAGARERVSSPCARRLPAAGKARRDPRRTRR